MNNNILTKIDRIIIKIIIQNNMEKLYHGKDTYHISKHDEVYTLFINGLYFKSFRIENNKIIT